MSTKAVRTKNLKKTRNQRMKSRVSVETKRLFRTDLKVGDSVFVLLGGNSKKNRSYQGKVGKILRFLPKKNRVVIEGVAMITKHKRAASAGEQSGKIMKEGSVHISNVMYYSEELKRPVRLKVQTLEDGRKVRGYVDPKTKAFQQIDV